MRVSTSLARDEPMESGSNGVRLLTGREGEVHRGCENGWPK